MSNFQITIIPSQDTGEDHTKGERFGVRQQGRGAGKVIERIDDLSKVWDQVIAKLSTLASQSKAAASKYELDSIEFNIGIEAGLSIGLVTKGDASVSLVFKNKESTGK